MYKETTKLNEYIGDSEELYKFRKWFRAAVENWNRWRDEAKEDYDFLAGKQWTDEELAEFAEQKRPALVINRIRPLINILSGWQRMNRFSISFLPRTEDDLKHCEIRAGVTKYVLDRCDYENKESTVFLDTATGGIGWFGVKYKFDAEIGKGNVIIERVSPFDMYVDPEAHELDFSDAKFICRAKWADKDDLKIIFPYKSDAIENNFNVYDPIEKENSEQFEIDPLWYSSELKKVRVVECWYKMRKTRTMILTSDGQRLPYTEENREQIMQLMMSGAVSDYEDVPTIEVRCCTFFDRTLLEDIPSPYKHGEFPYIPIIYHYYGVGDIPAGFVRSLKDPQREINKRRIQELHILNTNSNGGGYIEEGAMTPEQFEEFERMNAVPGHYNRVLSLEKIREREPKAPPAAVINAEQQATADLVAISGINENLLGTDISNGASGRAIELKQRQAITHLAPIFDNLRFGKKKLVNLLWGRRGHQGIIPQFYTAEDVLRIEGNNGQQFIHINQQVQDPLTGTIIQTMNDLSIGEFDVVISDVEATATQRIAKLFTLTDFASKLNIPGQILVKQALKLADIPGRDEIIAEYQQLLQQQAQAQQQEWQAKIQLEEIKNRDFRQTLAYKDLPLPLQMAMAAKAGYVDQQVANYFMQTMIEQLAPQLAQQMQQQAQQQIPIQQQPPQMPTPIQQPQPNNQPKTMTDAAARSVMAGSAPAAI